MPSFTNPMFRRESRAQSDQSSGPPPVVEEGGVAVVGQMMKTCRWLQVITIIFVLCTLFVDNYGIYGILGRLFVLLPIGQGICVLILTFGLHITSVNAGPKLSWPVDNTGNRYLAKLAVLMAFGEISVGLLCIANNVRDAVDDANYAKYRYGYPRPWFEVFTERLNFGDILYTLLAIWQTWTLWKVHRQLDAFLEAIETTNNMNTNNNNNRPNKYAGNVTISGQFGGKDNQEELGISPKFTYKRFDSPRDSIDTVAAQLQTTLPTTVAPFGNPEQTGNNNNNSIVVGNIV